MMAPDHPSKKISNLAFSVPTIMPDEYWIGYLGRILVFNGINYGIGHIAANQLLTNIVNVNNTNCHDLPTLVKLARLLKIEVSKFG